MGWVTEHEGHVAWLKSRQPKPAAMPSKRGAWSPIAPDPSGGWLLYGAHYDTREAAEAALTEQRRGGTA